MAALLVDDLPRLYREYFYARAQWYAIGCALGVSADDLEAIDRDHRGKCEDCFREVLLKWLRKRGSKTESELVQAIDDLAGDKPIEDPDMLLPISRVSSYSVYSTVAVKILLGIMLGLLAGYVYRKYTTSSLITAAHTLRGLYRHQPVIEFELLDYTTNMPYINVTMQHEPTSTSKTVDFWELLNDLDSEHMELQATNQPSKLERILITGHPGAGKTTLMRHLAKEWAKGTRLRSCTVLFLIQFGRLSKDQKPQCLSDLLQLSPYKLLDRKGLSEEIQQRQGAGACFLLDSYDEWIWRKDFIYQLFFEFNLHSSLCILTSRPSSGTIKFSTQPGIEHIRMVGFKISDLEKHLETLSTDSHVTNSIIRLWNSNRFIKELCTLPLYMMMLLSITKNEERLVLNTRTEIYSAFMNVTVKHFSDHHPDWNTVSLWECILNVSDSHSDKLCIAFKELHRVAFEMFFNRVYKFPDRQEINCNINKLGFVNVTKVDTNGDEVKYTFYHPTFQEFFVAIHLLSLKQDELLYLHIKKSIWRENNPWLFYFGLIGAHYSEENVSAILKQLSINRWMSESCAPFCYETITFKRVHEIGWTGKKLDELLESAGIVANSTVYVDFDLDSIILGYILNHTTIRTLRLEYKERSYYNFLYIEDNNLKAVSYAQLESLKSCKRVQSWIPLAVPMMTHLHFKLHRNSFNTFVCLLEAATNLHSLHIHLEDDYVNYFYSWYYTETVQYNVQRRSVALTSIHKLGQNLQTLSLTFGPLYLLGDLLPYISFLKNISSKYQLIHELKIGIEPQRLDKLIVYIPQLTLLFNEIKHLHNLQKFTFTGSEKLSLLRLGRSRGVLRDIFWLNELQSLELRNMMASDVQMLSRYFSHTLRELDLCENGITDYHIDEIARRLRDLHDLKSLSLCRNLIVGGRFKTLMKALTSHRNFSSIDLSYNLISDSDNIKELGKLRNLRELKLKGSGVDVKELVNVLLSNNITLESLSISVNKTTGIRSLQPLDQLSDLRHLDISEDEWQQEVEIKHPHETSMLVEMLKHLNKLESFKLCSHVTVRCHWTIYRFS